MRNVNLLFFVNLSCFPCEKRLFCKFLKYLLLTDLGVYLNMSKTIGIVRIKNENIVKN